MQRTTFLLFFIDKEKYYDISFLQIQLTRMYFSDEMELLGSLNQDWTNLLKNIRRREEIHTQLLKNNKNIVDKSWTDEEEEDIITSTSEYQKFLNQIARENHQYEKIQKEIIEKYTNNTTSYDGVIKFMSRVATSVMEIVQMCLPNILKFDSSIQDKLTRLKRTLVNMLNLKQKLNLEHFISVVLDYSKGKMQVELLKFQKLTKTVQTREFVLLKDIYQPKDTPKISSLQKIRQFTIEKKRQYSLTRQDREYIKKKSSLKKQKTRIYENLYSIVHQAKNQWNDDLFSSIQQAKSKLFQDLLHRNRYNNSHIKQHCKLDEQFQRKVAIFNQNPPKLSFQLLEEEIECPSQIKQKPKLRTTLSKEKGVPQSKSTQIIQPQIQSRNFQNNSCVQNVPKKSKPQLVQSIMFHEFLATEAENYSKCQDIQNDLENFVKKKMSTTRSKFPPHPSSSVRDSQDFPQIFNRTIQTQINDSQSRFDQIKKEVSYEGKRRKLPQINRGTSFDKHTLRIPKTGQKSSLQDINNIEDDLIKTNKRKQRWYKEDKIMSQRTKVTMKNVEVGIDQTARREDYFSRKEDNFGKDKKKTESTLMESTAYCKRTLNKFFDTKLNGF